MAHVGKTYPLHFRRDLCLNQSNHRLCYPKIFKSQFTVVYGSTPGTIWQTPRIFAQPVAETDGALAQWETEEITHAGLTGHMRIRVIDQMEGIVRLYNHADWVSGGVVKCRWLCSVLSAFGCQKLEQVSLTVSAPLIYDAGYWGGAFLGGGFSGVAAVWADL